MRLISTMMKSMKRVLNVRYILPLVVGVAVMLYFGLALPSLLRFQEQLQLFLCSGSYASDVCYLPGGVADYVGRFVTQFFLHTWGGVTLLSLLLVTLYVAVVQLIVNRPIVNRLIVHVLALLPVLLMCRFLSDDSALLGGLVALLLVVLAAMRLPRRNLMAQGMVALVLLPAMYQLAGPLALLLAVMAAGAMLRAERSLVTAVWIIVLTIEALVLPFVWRELLVLPLDRLFYGLHYYRNPQVTPVWLWASGIMVTVLYVLPLREPKCGMRSWTMCIAWASVTAMVCVVAMGYNARVEEAMHYDFMARMQHWNRIMRTADQRKPNGQIPVTALNLALAMKGRMADHMFEYQQNGSTGLLPVFVRDAVSPLVTSEAYYQLGMVNTAQRFTFEAQEAIPDFQKSVRCYKRLAETNLICGRYEVARKYLMALRQTLFYREWADETLALLGNEEAIDRHEEYGRLRQCIVADDYFYSERDIPQMLGRQFLANPTNRIAFEYLLAANLLAGDIGTFVQCFDMGFTQLGYSQIPTAWQQALLMWWSRTHTAQEQMPGGIRPEVKQQLNEFYAMVQQKRPEAEIAQRFGETYWYYYFYMRPK